MTRVEIETLLADYANARSAEARERLRGETSAARQRTAAHAEQAARVEQELRGRWVEEGRQPAELTKLLRQADYAQTVEVLFSGVFTSVRYREALEEQKSLASDLRSFWVTSGHDLDELRRFLSSVDARALELVPK